MKISLFICFASLLICGIASPVSKEKIDNNYRLPQSIKPNRYEISLTIEEDAFQMKLYEGDVKIEIEVLEKTKAIKLHSSRQRILNIGLGLAADSVSIPYTSYDIDNDTNIFTINFEKELELGKYDLSIRYIGTLGDDDMYGFYQSTYKDDKGVDHILATTQFESEYARRAFPCFDEPQFKAKFALTVLHPAKYTVIANTKPKTTGRSEILSKTEFEDSELMSSYLVAFIMSEFTVSANKENTFSVYSRPDSDLNRGTALKYGPEILTHLSTLTKVDYYKTMNMAKMDVVAIPDFAAGAMENWGLVTYREVVLLDDGTETAALSTQKILMVIAHEFAHQWFGDYVTLDWWSNTWLNEGFATYFENYISDKVEPEFKVMDQFVVNVLQVVFQADSVKSALPLSSLESDINTLSEIDNKFDSISYDKGGSILRMITFFLGQDKFEEGIQTYLSKKTDHQNVKPDDLWTEFTSPIADKKMSEIMDSWVNKPGLSIVQVSLTSDKKISLSQERFLLNNDEQNDDTKWYIPISYTKKSSKAQFDTSKEAYSNWLTPSDPDNTMVIPVEQLADDEWVIVNNKATGYFRTNYDTNLWGRIIKALKAEDFETINELNRAQLIDDIFNLARVKKTNYKTVFDLADYLKKETNYYAWTSAFNAFSFLLKRTGPSSLLGQTITERISTLMDALYKKVIDNKEPSHIDILNAAQAKKWACDTGKEECIKDALDQFEKYRADNTKKPSSNDRSYIYCTALKHSETIKEDWSFLRDQFTATKSSAEQTLILNALGCTTDKEILKGYLEDSIKDDSDIRKQDTGTVFKSVYSGTTDGTEVAFEFLKENYKAIAEKYKGMNSLSTIISGIADRFTEEKQIKELQDFVTDESLPADFKAAAEQAIETATANVNWLSTFKKDLEQTFGIDDGDDGPDGANAIGASITLVISLVVFFL